VLFPIPRSVSSPAALAVSRALLRSQGMDPAPGSRMAGVSPPQPPCHPEPSEGHFPGTLSRYEKARGPTRMGGTQGWRGGSGSSPTSIATLLPRAEKSSSRAQPTSPSGSGALQSLAAGPRKSSLICKVYLPPYPPSPSRGGHRSRGGPAKRCEHLRDRW